MTNEPKPPTRCDLHGIDWTDITNFGSQRRRMCGACGQDPDVPADALYAEALEKYERDKLEYDRLTPRICELEAELRAG